MVIVYLIALEWRCNGERNDCSLAYINEGESFGELVLSQEANVT